MKGSREMLMLPATRYSAHEDGGFRPRLPAGRPQEELSWRSVRDVYDASPCEFDFVRLSSNGRQNRENDLARRNRYRLQAYCGMGFELSFYFTSHACCRRRCRFLGRLCSRRRASCAKAANFFGHSLVNKTIERDAVPARQKDSPPLQGGREAKREAEVLFVFVVVH